MAHPVRTIDASHPPLECRPAGSMLTDRIRPIAVIQLYSVDKVELAGQGPRMNVAFRVFSAFALAVGLAMPGVAKTPDERIVEGVAIADQLWVRNSSGAVISYNLKTGRKTVSVARGVADLAAHAGRIWTLRHLGQGYEVRDLRSGRTAAPFLQTDDGLLALIPGPDLFALGWKSVFRLEDGKWISQKLDNELQGGLQISPVATSSGRIYVGFNRGEWGGGLFAIDPRTGHVKEVRRVDADPCDGPLAHECDPVTGLIHDPQNPDCVLAAVGLAHFSSHGRVLRVCNMEAEVIFSRAVPLEPDEMDMGSTWPFFGLVSANHGWVGVSYGRLFRSTNGVVTESALPKLEDWHGLSAAFVGNDFIALSTDINWTKSLSGRTPLLVQIEK